MEDEYIDMARKLPARLQEATVEGITADPSFDPVREYLAHLEANIRKGMGLLLCGPNGAGKTGAMSAVFQEVKRRWPGMGAKNLMWCRARDIALSYGYFKTDSTFDEPVDRLYEGSRVLVIDELGRESDIKNYNMRMHNLFGIRRDNRRVTSFTSNLPPDQLAIKYGPGFMSLLAETCLVVQVGGDDRRQA